jgi:aminomethyltransferase
MSETVDHQSSDKTAEPSSHSDAPQSALLQSPLQRTPLHGLHLALGARMAPFAGYDMPIQYASGIISEHNHTRTAAGLFDVSHMGQAFLIGASHHSTALALEALVPADLVNLAPGRQRYTQLLNEEGGILDDLMVTRPADPAQDGVLMLVVNAACKVEDFAHIQARLPNDARLLLASHRALLALQGPKAAKVLARHCPSVESMAFMSARVVSFNGLTCHVSRSGYTGEDGFEMSMRAELADQFARTLLRDEAVKMIGLGARDSLRLEAGLCLYGHDIDVTTSPVEAGLAWSIQKRRRIEGGFPGAQRIQLELAEGPKRLRVGLVPESRQPAREGTEILNDAGEAIGMITSGGFVPSLNGPVAMGYVDASHAQIETQVHLIVRGKALGAKIAPMPFVPHRYVRT